VLGPEKLPRAVSELGRWVGRARAMARQFREQLEEEVQLEEARKAQRAADAAPPVEPAPAAAAAPAPAAGTAPDAGAARASGNGGQPEVLPETFSHAHPTDATGADPTAVRPVQPPGADERRT